MIGLLLNKYTIGAAAAVLILGGAYVKGRTDGAALCRAEAVKATQAQISERGKTDAKVNTLGPDGLCELLGGVLADGQCQ